MAHNRLKTVALLLVLVVWLTTACELVGALPTLVPTLTPSPASIASPTAGTTSGTTSEATATLDATLASPTTSPVDATLTPGGTLASPTTSPADAPAALTPTVGATSTPEPPGLTGVLIISVDGLRADAVQLADTPNLDRLVQRGAASWTAQTVLPSVTLPGHASMLSGSSPAVHGVTWNVYDPSRGYIAVPTLFSVFHNAGFSTAFLVGKAKLEHIAVPGTVDFYGYVIGTDADVAGLAVEQLLQSSPDLVVVHLPDVDSVGHVHGWLTSPQLEAVTRADEAVGTLLSTLEEMGRLESTLIIVTADHGGIGKSHGGDNPESMTIPWIIAGPGVREGYVIEGDVKVYDTAVTAAWAWGLPLPEEWEGRPIEEAFWP